MLGATPRPAGARLPGTLRKAREGLLRARLSITMHGQNNLGATVHTRRQQRPWCQPVASASAHHVAWRAARCRVWYSLMLQHAAGVYASHVHVRATATYPYHAAAALHGLMRARMLPVAHTPEGRCYAAARPPPRRHAQASGAGTGAPQQPRRPGERPPLPPLPPRPPPWLPPPRLAALRGCTRAALRRPRPR